MTLVRLADSRPLSLPTKLALSVEVVVGFMCARLALRRHDVRAALARLRRSTPGRDDGEDAYAMGARLGQVVATVLRALPADSRCLMMSVVLSTMLARRGVASVIVIGVRSGRAFGAHAWVELDGRAILPAGSDYEQLVEL